MLRLAYNAIYASYCWNHWQLSIYSARVKREKLSPAPSFRRSLHLCLYKFQPHNNNNQRGLEFGMTISFYEPYSYAYEKLCPYKRIHKFIVIAMPYISFPTKKRNTIFYHHKIECIKRKTSSVRFRLNRLHGRGAVLASIWCQSVGTSSIVFTALS